MTSETLYLGEQGAPLVVVLHDWFGRLPWLERYAAALVAEGLQVAIPDFYDGFTTTELEGARGQMKTMDIGGCLAVIDDILDEARLYGSERVGTLGFSTGGWLALVHAQGGEVDAVVAYYASIADRHHSVIPCPVLLQYAEKDEWEYGGDPRSFFDRLEEHGTPVTHFSYGGTQHHFANPAVAESDPHAAALAQARAAAFLAAQLDD
jgi:carboxymethylenebutenolidase